MNRTELTIVIAVTILAAMAVGWLLHWGFTRINRASLDSRDDNDMAARLHDAETARDAAYAEAEAAVLDMQKRLTQTEAELEAAMDGLGIARREAIDLRAELDSLRGG